jgi:hypothetical protein
VSCGDGNVTGRKGAGVYGMEMNHIYCQMVFPLGGNCVHGMEMNHMACFNPTVPGVLQGQNCLAKP